MIAVQLLGGLGNQMFQAAAGYALARRHKTRLIFDLSRYREKGLRAYALTPFGLEADVRAGREGLFHRARQAMGLAPRHVPAWWYGAVFHEAGFAHDPGFRALGDDVLISGYFQSFRYFEPFVEEIALRFGTEKLASAEARLLAEQLEGEQSVAIHLRRGDYAVNKRAQHVHGVLPERYYEDAADHVASLVPGARYFLFSDDPAAAAALAARLPRATPMRGTSAGDDLFLMSRARHHILANSSFSWWSAWLDRRPGGIRIAPQAWFTPEAAASRPTDDLIPRDWVRL
jgi:hypothetical protein